MITSGGRANNLLKVSFLETENSPPDLPDGAGPEKAYTAQLCQQRSSKQVNGDITDEENRLAVYLKSTIFSTNTQ